jgi:flagellar hook-associated protein 2
LNTTLPGTYRIEVVSVGSRTTAASNPTLPVVSDYLQQNISSASAFNLTVSGATFSIVPKANTLASLAEALNANENYGVQAVIVNEGSTAAPNYKLSVQSKSMGPVVIQIDEQGAGGQSLLSAGVLGSLASYRINGEPAGAPLTSDVATGVSIAPGLKVDFLKAGTSDVVVSRDQQKASASLANVATAYNKLMAELDKNRGDSTSPLNSHSVLNGVAYALRRFMNHTAVGAVKSTEQLGFTFDDKGILSFDSSKFEALSTSAVAEFLGSAAQPGFLALAEQAIAGIDAKDTGLLPSSLTSVRNQIAETDRQVIANQERVELLKQRLAAQMAAADALIGQLEQQVNYMNGLFESMRINARS